MADRTLSEILSLDSATRQALYKSQNIEQIEIDGNVLSGYFDYSYFDAKSYTKSPSRSMGGVIGGLDSYVTFLTPRLRIKFSMMSIDTYRTLMKLIQSKNEFSVTCYDIVWHKSVTHKMYFEPEDFPALFVRDLETLAVLDYEIVLTGTNSEVEEITITYHLNPPTGSDETTETDPFAKNVSFLVGSETTYQTATYEGYRFSNWSLSADNSDDFTFLDGGEYIFNQSLDLYAVWIAKAELPINVGEKTITQNGVYEAEDDSLAGYSKVTVAVSGEVEPPTTSSQSIFTGATIPLTYKDNAHANENTYVYASQTHNITITGLDGRANITNNGTKTVTVAFIVTSATSSLKNFTISCTNSFGTRTFTGMHAHYGTACTGILTFAYKNITKDGSEGTINTNYLFIETDSGTLPLLYSNAILWSGIYSYQLLNVLIGNYSGTTIGNDFLGSCYSFNQPLDLSGITSIGNSFLERCYAFNQPLIIPSSVSSIGTKFMNYCYSFNQPIDLGDVATIGDYFLQNCYSFNQPLNLSGASSTGNYFLQNCYSFNQPIDLGDVATIGNYFLSTCYSFNQPLDLSGVSSIGSSFLQQCYSFNQPLIIPANVNSVGTGFMYNAYALSTIIWETTTYPIDNNSLSQALNTKPNATYGAGIIIYGSKSSNLKTALADRTSSPYRKLIDGEA